MTSPDLIQIIPHGRASAQSTYVPFGEVGGSENYSYQVPVTGFSIAAGSTVTKLVLNPAGTLANGTLTMPANPLDGQQFTVFDTQTQSAITINAATGQSMLTSIGLGAVTALTANTNYTWLFDAALAGWIRTL